MRLSGLLAVNCLLFAVLSGCGPTYPKERFKESIVRVCKAEYKLDVKVETIGKTITIYLSLPDLIDFTFSVTKTAREKINDVILSVSRAALSTNAKFDFYCIVAHDVRIPEIQIVIIKSVDDVKRFLLNDISRGEYSKRMLVDIRVSPQAQKERAIKDVFEKMAVDKKWQEQVMNDFFRSEPAVLGDIGYWNNHFYIKDISLSEFLAEQIANRIRMDSREEKALADILLVKSAKGSYASKASRRLFRLEILAESKWFEQAKEGELADKIFQVSLKVAGDVIHGYRFEDFDYIEVINQQDAATINVSREELEALRLKKIKFENIVNKL